MNILRISTRIFPDTGGPAKQAYLLSEYLSENNFKVFNIASELKDKAHIKKEKVNDNFEIHYLPIQAPGIHSGSFTQIIFLIEYVIYGFIKVIEIQRKHRIDLIHAHSPPPAGYLAWFISKIFGVPYVYSIHGLDYPNAYAFILDMNVVARNSKKTIVVSKKIETILKRKFGLIRIFWLPNGIVTSNYYHIKSKNEKEILIKKLNLDLFLDKDDFIITYIGFMIFFQKVCGMLDFLEAFSRFLTKIQPIEIRKKIKLIYIGNGEYLDLLKEQIRKLNLNNNVFLLGKREDVRDILAFSDLLAISSYIEGFPNVILEAMSSKVPCLGTDVGDIKFIIGDTGYIVKPGDIINIEKFIDIHFNLDEFKRLKLMQKTYERVKNNFDMYILGKKLIDLYLKD